MTFGGVKKLVSRKAALVVPVAQLPLKNPAAHHKFKLLAGVRWSSEPPKDAGLAKHEVEKLSQDGKGHGYFKISHEAMPELAMNLKWCSDTIDRLVAEANDAKDTFADVPLDTRHLFSQAEKRRKGRQRLGPNGEQLKRATIADFPEEWLPSESQVEGMRRMLVAQQRKRSRGAVFTPSSPSPVQARAESL